MLMIDQTHKTSPKDIFLQLLAIVTLYGSAGGVLALLFQFINIRVPDPLSYGSIESARWAIRFAVSSLVVVFPVYIWVLRSLSRAYAAEPERKEIRIRKWLVYFTLFAAGLIIMGDVVALVNSFLNGELTTRFLLKVLSVFVVAGAVFWYYYWDIKDKEPQSMQMFCWAVLCFVVLTVGTAFFFVGSPQQERLRQFDQQRVNDLQTIQWQIVNYWQTKAMLPSTLSALEDDISGFRVPVDPENATTYEYRVITNTSFELCAGFRLDMNENWDAKRDVGPYVYPADNWDHGSGRVCFERTIDPDLYPPKSVMEKPLPIAVPAR